MSELRFKPVLLTLRQGFPQQCNAVSLVSTHYYYYWYSHYYYCYHYSGGDTTLTTHLIVSTNTICNSHANPILQMESRRLRSSLTHHSSQSVGGSVRKWSQSLVSWGLRSNPSSLLISHVALGGHLPCLSLSCVSHRAELPIPTLEVAGTGLAAPLGLLSVISCVSSASLSPILNFGALSRAGASNTYFIGLM